MFSPPPAPQPAAPSRKQPKRQAAQRIQRGDAIVISTSTDHRGLLQTADKKLKIYRRIRVEVDEVISENVVKGNSLDLGTIALKFFPADSARMLSEILAYKALQRIQGLVVPEFIDVFVIEGFKGYALGLSAVDGSMSTSKPMLQPWNYSARCCLRYVLFIIVVLRTWMFERRTS